MTRRTIDWLQRHKNFMTKIDFEWNLAPVTPDAEWLKVGAYQRYYLWPESH